MRHRVAVIGLLVAVVWGGVAQAETFTPVGRLSVVDSSGRRVGGVVGTEVEERDGASLSLREQDDNASRYEYFVTRW